MREHMMLAVSSKGFATVGHVVRRCRSRIDHKVIKRYDAARTA